MTEPGSCSGIVLDRGLRTTPGLPPLASRSSGGRGLLVGPFELAEFGDACACGLSPGLFREFGDGCLLGVRSSEGGDMTLTPPLTVLRAGRSAEPGSPAPAPAPLVLAMEPELNCCTPDADASVCRLAESAMRRSGVRISALRSGRVGEPPVMVCCLPNGEVPPDAAFVGERTGLLAIVVLRDTAFAGSVPRLAAGLDWLFSV